MAKEIDIKKHVLVPKHEILKEEETKKLLNTYNVNRGQLPKISINDPVIESLEAKEGDIIRITRKSDTNIKSPYYRVVVSD